MINIWGMIWKSTRKIQEQSQFWKVQGSSKLTRQKKLQGKRVREHRVITHPNQNNIYKWTSQKEQHQESLQIYSTYEKHFATNY